MVCSTGMRQIVDVNTRWVDAEQGKHLTVYGYDSILLAEKKTTHTQFRRKLVLKINNNQIWQWFKIFIERVPSLWCHWSMRGHALLHKRVAHARRHTHTPVHTHKEDIVLYQNLTSPNTTEDYDRLGLKHTSEEQQGHALTLHLFIELLLISRKIKRLHTDVVFSKWLPVWTLQDRLPSGLAPELWFAEIQVIYWAQVTDRGRYYCSTASHARDNNTTDATNAAHLRRVCWPLG